MKPGCALSSSRVSGVLRAEKAEKKAVEMVIPFPYRRLFQVHGSEFKLHPVCYLGQASVLHITHRVVSFGVRKDPFYRLFTFLIKRLVLRCISGIVCQFFVGLPDMPLHCLDTVFGMSASLSGRAAGAYFWVASVFPVSVTVCRVVF